MLTNNRIKFAAIPEAFRDLRLDSFRTSYYKDQDSIRQIVDVIKEYLKEIKRMKEDGVGLYIWSKTKGSGKTRLVTSLANELIYEYDMKVKFITSLDIIAEIRATWDKSAEFTSESKLMEYLTTVEVLVIDDFGTETHKDWLDDKFYQIINTRYVNRLITIFTSNESLNTMDYDERITSRIVERCYQLHFPEQSIREGLAIAKQRQLEERIKNGGQGNE